MADHWMHSGDLADEPGAGAGLAVVGVEPRIRGRAHCHAGMLAFWEGRDEQARAAFQAAREVAQEAQTGPRRHLRWRDWRGSHCEPADGVGVLALRGGVACRRRQRR